MKILITGSSGMLGEAVFSELKDHHDVYATSNNKELFTNLDVTSVDMVEEHFRTIKPDAVIHLAALTDLEYCHCHPDRAYDVNFIGTWNIAKAARKYGSILVYISSAGIFDGKKDIYTVDDVPSPLNVYAKTKFAGELAALSVPKSIIIRAGWMMGGGPEKDKTFTNKIIKKIRDGAKEIFVVNDTFGTVTYTPHIANVMHKLILGSRYGIHHVACIDNCSRVDIAEAILYYFDLERKITITPVTSDYFKQDYFVVRPASERVTNSTTEYAPYWRLCLEEYLHKYEWGI